MSEHSAEVDALTPAQREELCICAYAHDARDGSDNEALIVGCDRYLDEVLTPFLSRVIPPAVTEPGDDQ